MNIWKIKNWLSQERKELLKWNKKHFSLFHKSSFFRHTKQTSKNVVDTTFKPLLFPCLSKIFLIQKFFLLKNFRVYCIIYLCRVLKSLESCLESTMKQQYVKYVKHKGKPCVKYVNSTIKAPEKREWCCSGVFTFDFRGIFTSQLKIYVGAFLGQLVNSQKLKYSIRF